MASLCSNLDRRLLGIRPVSTALCHKEREGALRDAPFLLHDVPNGQVLPGELHADGLRLAGLDLHLCESAQDVWGLFGG